MIWRIAPREFHDLLSLSDNRVAIQKAEAGHRRGRVAAPASQNSGMRSVSRLAWRRKRSGQPAVSSRGCLLWRLQSKRNNIRVGVRSKNPFDISAPALQGRALVDIAFIGNLVSVD